MEALTNDDDGPAELRSGRRDTLDRIMPIVYEHLRVIARHQLAKRGGGGTLSTTGLIHETYLKLVDQSRIAWSDRAHFLALASPSPMTSARGETPALGRDVSAA